MQESLAKSAQVRNTRTRAIIHVAIAVVVHRNAVDGLSTAAETTTTRPRRAMRPRQHSAAFVMLGSLLMERIIASIAMRVHAVRDIVLRTMLPNRAPHVRPESTWGAQARRRVPTAMRAGTTQTKAIRAPLTASCAQRVHGHRPGHQHVHHAQRVHPTQMKARRAPLTASCAQRVHGHRPGHQHVHHV
jgi:hypothetical protein